MPSIMQLGSRIGYSLIHSTQISHHIRLILGGNHPLPLSNSLAVKPMHTPCYDWFPHSLNMAPKQQTWAQLVSWPPVTRSASDAELSTRVSLLILRLREVSSLSVGNYIQFGRSHESDFHGIT